MESLFSQFAVLGSSLVLISGLALLWRRGSAAHIAAFTAQSLALAGTIALIAGFTGSNELWLVAALFLAVKGVVMPLLLKRMERRFREQREPEPYVNTATSLVIGGFLVLLAYIVTRPILGVSHLPTRAAMPLAMGLIFVSLLVIISRKKALTQVIGFLALENGIALLAALGTYGIPFIVEMGVFLDALMGFLVMQIVIYRIQETFESIDVEQLNRLSQ
jgi:hydrogenase-4 component E